MKSRTTVMCVLAITLFLCTMFVSNSTPLILSQTENTEQMMQSETYGDNRRNDPVSILIQTQFVDTSVDQEWDHVLSSLKTSLNGKFIYDNLTDYRDLASVIDEYDILLIPENENGNLTTASQIAGEWSSFLPTYVENGGIVICMAYRNAETDFGTTAEILNGTGLMELYNPSTSYLHQLNVVFTYDALARNMPASFTGASGSVCFDTWDGTPVVRDDTNDKAVVVHKTMGKGHVVLLGFDMWSETAEQDMLLANAVRLHNHVVIDYSHDQDMSIYGGLTNISEALPYEGFAVSSMNFFSPAMVEACDILVITQCVDVYTAGELDIIDDFLNSGGGLFIGTEVSIWGLALDPFLEHFGYARRIGWDLNDTDDSHGDVAYLDLYPENLNMHSSKVGVDHVEVHSSTGFITMPDSATPILTTDTDGTCFFSSDIHGSEPADGIPIAAVECVGEGRIALIADNSLISDFDVDSDGSEDYFDSDNELFIDNIFRWLAGAGIPEQTVAFDYSKSAWGNLHDTLNGLAELLMFNGYNTIWTTDFDPDVYDEADILFISDGTLDYNTSEIAYIETYVQEGGAVLLWGDWSTFCQQVDPIAQEFGLVVNTTHNIQDLDDFISNSFYVVYDGANIGTHPIMDGINRIEVSLSTGFNSIGSGTALISTDNDGSAIWSDMSTASNVPVFAVTTYENGRVAFITDQNMGGLVDSESDGFPNLYDSDNPIFVANVFTWLTENRAPTVEVTYPNGGEKLEGVVTVNWTASDFDGDILEYDVFYSSNNGSDWNPLALGLLVAEYEWNTEIYSDGIGYMIRVVVSDGLLTNQDESDDPFEVDNPHCPTVELISPIGGEVLNGTVIISWTAEDVDGDILTFEVRYHDGVSWTTLVSDYDQLEYEWDTTSVDDGTDYRVAVLGSDGYCISLAQSVDTFEIDNPDAPTVELTYPNGGEVLNGTISISWTANDADGDSLTFDIFYSDNSGSDWTLLAENLTGLTYAWNTTAHDDGTGYLIRVVCSDGIHTSIDESDNPFELDNFGGSGPGPGPGPGTTTIIITIVVAGVVIVIIIVIVKGKKG